MDDYIDKIAVPQVREILSNYGEFPAVLWWDTSIDMNTDRVAKLLAVGQGTQTKHHHEQSPRPGFSR
ncbi:MAG: hypothetical protein WDM76_03750 [Limisphaerales bacterium]